MLQPAVHNENSNNFELTKLCLKGRWCPTALQQVYPIVGQTGFDWSKFSEYALQESIAPILYEILSKDQKIAAENLVNLREYYLDAAVTNTLLFQELSDILIKLNQAQVDVILLKGAALATQIYPNIAMRPMVDLDILVKPNDVPVAVRTLQTFGYQISRQEEKPGFTLDFENEVALYKHDSIPKLVEVHWSLFNSIYYQYKIPNNWIWKSTIPVEINHVPTLMLDPVAQILHLCGHLSIHHPGTSWLWTHDLAELLMHDRGDIDWDKLMSLAQKNDLVLPVKSVLPAVAETYGEIIPEEITKRINALVPADFEDKYFQKLKSAPKTSGRTFLEDFNYLPDWRKKISFTISSLFPTLAYMKVRYGFSNPALLPLFYIYRWYLGIASLYTKG